MTSPASQPTLAEVLAAVQAAEKRADTQFQRMEERFDGLDERLDGIASAWGECLRDLADIKKKRDIPVSEMTDRQLPGSGRLQRFKRRFSPGSQFSIWKQRARSNAPVTLTDTARAA